jgi:diadenosine tetraphosphate (Ap4A) HIT family hydrolase
MTAMIETPEWELHPMLVRESLVVGDMPLSRLLASKDAGYPWLMLVPRRTGAIEIFDLPPADQAALVGEISQVSRALKALTNCDKINVGNIGIVVPQLHVHVVARHRGDPAWPRGMWGAAPPKAYAAGVLEKFVEDVRKALNLK